MSRMARWNAVFERYLRRLPLSIGQVAHYLFPDRLFLLSPNLRNRWDPLDIPAHYGDAQLELRYQMPMHTRLEPFLDPEILGYSLAMLLGVWMLRILGIWLANDFVFSLCVLASIVLATGIFQPGLWVGTLPSSVWIVFYGFALLVVKGLAGNAAGSALLALAGVFLTCVVADQVATNFVLWALAHPRRYPSDIAKWQSVWSRRFQAPAELPDYWLGFAGIAVALLASMVLSVAVVPHRFLGMGFVILYSGFLGTLLLVSIFWQPTRALRALSLSWKPLVVWFYYNPNQKSAPGVYQSPFSHRPQRTRIVLALLILSLLPLASYFPLHMALVSGTPWVESASAPLTWNTVHRLSSRSAAAPPSGTRSDSRLTADGPRNLSLSTTPPPSEPGWSSRLDNAPESWMLIAARGAFTGDSRFTWALVVGVLASITVPVFILFTTCALITSRAIPTIFGSLQLRPIEDGTDFDFYVERIQNSSYVHPDGTRECDHLLIGSDAVHGRPILLARSLLDGHAHILGSTQSGKTSRALSPMLAQMIRSLRPGTKEYQSQSSILVLDLKGEKPMFHNVAHECKERGVKFKYFTTGYRDATFAFNPFEQSHLADVSPDQRSDMLARAMGIFYGHKYPEVFWSDINAQVFRALLLNYAEIRSFARFHCFMKDPKWYRQTGGFAEDWKKAGHVKAAADKLARIVPLNVTAKETPSAEVYRDRIDMRNLGSKKHDPEVVYFSIRATDDEAAGHAVAKLALFSLLTAVNTIPEQDKKRTYVVIDEFQYIALDILARLFEQAAGLKVSYILANQSLFTLPDIIQEVLAENTAFRQIFRAGSVKARKHIRERSGDSIYNLHSWTSEGYSDGRITQSTTTQHVGPGYFDTDVIKASYDNAISWVEMSAPRGFSQYGGQIFTMETGYHISKGENDRREALPWPPRGPSTLVAADEERILGAYQPRLMTSESLAETIEGQLQPSSPTIEPELSPVRPLPAFEACVAAFEQSLSSTEEHVRSGVAPESNPEGKAV